MRRVSTLLLVAAVLAVVGAAAGAQATAVQVRAGANGGSYLSDSRGMTLYYYTKDADGQSACSGNCLNSWPAFYAATITAPASLKVSDFGTITRADGAKQTTYLGWPLYLFARDVNPGDTAGEAANKVWYVMRPSGYTVALSTSATLGNYLVDSTGMALYWYTRDTPGQSVCAGDCVKNWPLFYTANPVVPSSLAAADFATITRADGSKQTTYKGYPLYYWVRDAKRGDTTGQDVGKVWYVIDPAKFPVTAS